MSEKMIVACPECQTRFVAPLEKFLPEGRKVRCAKCGHSWFQRITAKASAIAAAATTPAPTTAPPASTEDDQDDGSNISMIERAEERLAQSNRSRQEGQVAATATTDGTIEVPMVPAAPAPTPAQNPEVDAPAPVALAAAATTAAVAAASATAATATTPDYDHTHPGESQSVETTTAEAQTASTMPETILPPTQKPRKRRGFLRRGLFFLVAGTIIAGALAYFFKDPIAKQIPSIEPQLASWKQQVDGVVSKVIPGNSTSTLRLEGIQYEVDEVEGNPELRVSAQVTNDGTSVKPAPKLAVQVLAADGSVLNETTLSPENLATEIAADGSEVYFWRLPYPPENLDRVEVRFAE